MYDWQKVGRRTGQSHGSSRIMCFWFQTGHVLTCALAKRPAAVDLAVQELEALIPQPRYRITTEMGSDMSDKEFKEDIRALIETGLKPCGNIARGR